MDDDGGLQRSVIELRYALETKINVLESLERISRRTKRRKISTEQALAI